MDDTQVESALDEILGRLRKADWKARDGILEELKQVITTIGANYKVMEHLENAKKSLPLEVRWDLDEVLESFQPESNEDEAGASSDEPDEETPDPNKPLSMADLTVVYDDPRGLVVYKSKVGERWFAAQPDPYTGQPRLFELGAQEVQQLKTQLAGSPYWVLGSGGAL